ncbi:MAG: hypothetical protein IIB17_00285 [Chloroflexi bacterium]|nr:hypothetical protein [Chloroflexota bacterium]
MEEAQGENISVFTPTRYWSCGGELVAVGGLDSALKALTVIVDQAERIDHTIFDGDHYIFDQDAEAAHYFRFNEILEERYYTETDSPRSGPTGAVFPVNWGAVYNMRTTRTTPTVTPISRISNRS